MDELATQYKQFYAKYEQASVGAKTRDFATPRKKHKRSVSDAASRAAARTAALDAEREPARRSGAGVGDGDGAAHESATATAPEARGEGAVSEAEARESFFYSRALAALKFLKFPSSFASLPWNQKRWVLHDYPSSDVIYARPAPPQRVAPNVAYKQASGEYNVWHGYNVEFASAGLERKSSKAETALAVFDDCGSTALRFDRIDCFRPFCFYFAKGCCQHAARCRYWHRLPTLFDNDLMPVAMDVFGRARPKASHHDNVGVSSLSSSGRVLIIAGFPMLKKLREAPSLADFVLAKFCIFGPVAKIKVVPTKRLVCVHFTYRAASEFAFVAMDGQELSLDDNTFVLSIRWGSDTAQDAAVDIVDIKARRKQLDALHAEAREPLAAPPAA